MSTSIDDDISTLKKQFPKIQFISTTNSFWKVTYRRTPTSRVTIKATLTFPDGCDSSSTTKVVVSIESGAGTINVPPGLKRKLEKELGETAATATTASTTCTMDVVSAVLTKLIDFIDTNHFVPCWKELRQVVDLINQNHQQQDDKADTIRMKETTGKIWLTFNTKKTPQGMSYYQYKCLIQIDSEYPNTTNLKDYGKSCRLQQLAIADDDNCCLALPDSMSSVITQQAQELVRRLQDGMPPAHALKMSNPIPLPPSTPTKDDETSDEAWQRHDLERRQYYGIPTTPTYDGSQPQLSLLPLVEFLQKTIHLLPNHQCPHCNQSSLVSPPQKTTSKSTKTAKPDKKQRPILTHCGHWYHWECLDTLMRHPPFGKIDFDEVYNKKKGSANKKGNNNKSPPPLYHPDWSQEAIPERERAYQQQQAREREIADAADFF